MERRKATLSLDDFEQSNNTAMLVPNTNTKHTYLLLEEVRVLL